MQAKTGWRRWNSRWIARALLVALLPLATAVVIMHRAYAQTASSLVVERNQQLAYLSAARLEDELLSISEVLSTLSRTPEIYRRNVAGQSEALQDASYRLAAFDGGVVLLDSFGIVRVTVPERPEILRQDWSEQRLFQEMLASSDIAFSDGVNEGPDGSMVTMVGVPIRNEKGEFVGVLVGMFDLGKSKVNTLYASIVRLRIGQSGTTYLIDSNGKVLYDSNYAELGETFDTRTLPAGSFLGSGGAGRTRDSNEHDVVVAYAPVPLTGWTLITEDDWSVVTRPTRRYSNALLALLAVGMVIPAAGLGLFVHQRQAEMHEQERLHQATRVAGLVQQALLPRHVPLLLGWNLTVHHQPASTMGGDFYDYLILPDGHLVLTVGDVADTSVQAAVVAATTRAALRAAAYNALAPCAALAQACRLLCPEMQAGKGVTCLYAMLDPSSGRLESANAGYAVAHFPGKADEGQVSRAGQPLGLVLGSQYEQCQVTIGPGQFLLLVTDGLIGAHNLQGEPFGSQRLEAILDQPASSGREVVDAILAELTAFVGAKWQQEDDITLVVLERAAERPPA